MPPQYTTDDIARFWSKVQKTATCWLWVAHKSRQGYGSFRLPDGPVRAHRFVYRLTYGAIPEGMHVCHHCDVPACVRPDHLFLGTNADNVNDKMQKGREARGAKLSAVCAPKNPARGDNHGSRTKPGRLPKGDQHYAQIFPERLARGEDQGSAKLTADDVREIRKRYAAGEKGCDLAREFGVANTNISAIIHRKTWQHIL